MTRTRICRTCQERFTPFLVTDALCRECLRTVRDRELVVAHLLAVRFTSVADVAADTGVSATVVQAMVDDGTIGASAPDDGGCTCPPGLPGRCPLCRRRLADGLRVLGGSVSPPATVSVTEPERRQSGLRARRPL